ncbi:MAG: NUDIX domain-containing protein [archaeon]
MPKDYFKPSVTVDIILFSIINEEIKVLLIRRGIPPFKGMWAIPGGFVREKEELEDAAKRELSEETGVNVSYLEQLYTFGGINRDPRGRVITITYFGLTALEQTLQASTDAEHARWFSIKKLPSLAFDHKNILEYALQRLRWKFEYTTVAFSVLPEKFTLTSLQRLYEVVFDKPFDKRNFRKKLFSLKIVEPTKEIDRNVSHRPPQFYKFVGKIGDIKEMV